MDPVDPSTRTFFMLIRGYGGAGLDREPRETAIYAVSCGSASVNQRYREVVADDDGEEDGVEAVEEAAVGAEDGAGVLGAEVPLQHRLEEVADRGDGRHRGADQEGVHAGESVLVEPGEPEAHRPDQEAADQALDRLVG